MRSRDGNATWDRTKNGSYRVRFYCEGNVRREKKVKTITDRDALIRAVKRRESLDYWYPEKAHSESSQLTGSFDALADLWLTHSEKVREISDSCLSNYVCHLKHHIRPVIGLTSLSELSLKDIEKVAEAIKYKKPMTKSYVSVRQNRLDSEFFDSDEFLSTSYRREILTVACMVTKFGAERGYLSANPFREFKLPECPEQPYDFWRLEDEDKFLLWLENGGKFFKVVGRPHSTRLGRPEKYRKGFKTRNVDDLYDVVLFALRSGLRKGEIGGITPRDVNFGKNCVVVRRSYSCKEGRMKDTTKGRTFRIVEMNEDMRVILKKRIERAKSDDEMLFNIKTWAIKNFSKYCRKAEVREIHFHSLRHTCLTNLANGYGMDAALPLPQVQKIAGHREIGTTMRYVHVDGIENTSSRQWSRAQRREKLEEQQLNVTLAAQRGLRLIVGGH
jgi:integrase